MPTRLDHHHRDPEYRAKNLSLHYFVWDRGDKNKMYKVKEEFVFLSATDRVDPLLLNLLEMWCCLMLQTLTKNALAKYLPANMVAPYIKRAGQGEHDLQYIKYIKEWFIELSK